MGKLPASAEPAHARKLRPVNTPSLRISNQIKKKIDKVHYDVATFCNQLCVKSTYVEFFFFLIGLDGSRSSSCLHF